MAHGTSWILQILPFMELESFTWNYSTNVAGNTPRAADRRWPTRISRGSIVLRGEAGFAWASDNPILLVTDVDGRRNGLRRMRRPPFGF